MLKAIITAIFIFMVGLVQAQQPVFKGGNNALYNFISGKIIYPEYSKQNCISGTIKVSFMVDKSGKVYNAKVVQGMGIDLDDEALRVVKLTSGKWIVPAKYEPTNIIIPISFDVDRTACGGRSAADINLAINGYLVRQRLEDAVTNYYAAKYKGTADTTKEAIIISLKKQLGYDDAFINDVLQQAADKFNEGDTDSACHDWLFIRNIGSSKADEKLAKYCSSSN